MSVCACECVSRVLFVCVCVPGGTIWLVYMLKISSCYVLFHGIRINKNNKRISVQVAGVYLIRNCGGVNYAEDDLIGQKQ